SATMSSTPSLHDALPISGPKVLLAGHLDEVAFMVSKMMDNGFLRLQPLGGWWGHVMLSQRVKIKGRDRDVIGVIGSKPPHVLPRSEEHTSELQSRENLVC